MSDQAYEALFDEEGQGKAAPEAAKAVAGAEAAQPEERGGDAPAPKESPAAEATSSGTGNESGRDGAGDPGREPNSLPSPRLTERGEDAPTPPKPAAESGQVPISALLDEREKRQAAERLARELQGREAAPPPAPAPALDASVQQALRDQNVRISRRFAERQYGAPAVAELHDWAHARCAADPLFNAQMKASEDPYETAMQARNRERILEKVQPDQLDAFLAWQAAQAEAASAAPAPRPPGPAAAPPPRSLADAPGAGLGSGPASPPGTPGSAFSAAIG